MLLSTVLVVAAANAVPRPANAPPRPWYELEHRVRELTRDIILNDSRAVFRAFATTFKQETDFARFDSALQAWHAGRRVAIGRGQVIDTRGVSGRASSWVVFAGGADHDYIYQSWVYAADTWRLAWLSNILDRSFDYGNHDLADVRAMRAATLDWLITGGGLAQVPPGHARPDTVLVIDPAGTADWLPDYPTAVRTPEQFQARAGLPATPLAFRFVLTRSFGPIGVSAVDIQPLAQRRGRMARHRSIQVFLARTEAGWRYLTTGSVW
ncbi:MAG TPA: hypothetical protein ENN51_04295 [candidate division WOR-3 bacterium]|uniref:Uncharacterized protein n=1 Tax=candidate division WOR-3 bacterium TaxID=2052148 RepID=A0A7V0XEX7_UNCW3|nr:hypothetical protein [candidate division WOR-3 bacterium]